MKPNPRHVLFHPAALRKQRTKPERLGTAALVASGLTLAFFFSTANAATRTWDGEHSTGASASRDNWTNNNNWDNNAQPLATDDVVFGSAFSSGTSIDLNGNKTVNSLTINTTTAFSLDGGDDLTLTSGQLIRNDVTGTEGDHLITANLILGANGAFNINGSGLLTISGVIQDGANLFNLTKSGTGTLVLSGGAETYNGDTIVNGGILRLGAANQLADGTGFGHLVVNNGATFDLAGFGETINGLSGSGTVDSNFNSSTTLTLGGGNASGNFSGTITDTLGTLSLTKIGDGTQILSGQNTYAGATNVNVGTLLANNGSGSATGTGAINIASGAIFGGNGTSTPTGSNGINVSGVLAPGSGVGQIGNLTLNLGSTTGSVTMAGGSSFQFELEAAGVTIASFGTSDLLTIAGAAANDFAFINNNIDFQNTGEIGFYKLFDTSSNNADTWTGLTFDGTTGEITSGLTVSNLASGLTGTLLVGTAANGGTTGDIYLHVVPEPSAALLGGVGVFFLLRRRDRK